MQTIESMSKKDGTARTSKLVRLSVPRLIRAPVLATTDGSRSRYRT